MTYPSRLVVYWSLGALIAASLATGTAWAQERTWEWSWSMHPMSWMWGVLGMGMMLMMLVFWGLVVVGVVLGVGWLAGQGRESRPARALDIPVKRYRRGGINKAESEAKRRSLT